MGTRSSRSRFPHEETDTALNSHVRPRTVMARGAQSETERLWSWVAAPTRHDDRESIAQTGTMDVITKKLSQFASHFSRRRVQKQGVPPVRNALLPTHMCQPPAQQKVATPQTQFVDRDVNIPLVAQRQCRSSRRFRRLSRYRTRSSCRCDA